ncbi:MAG: right-handed parallel beta-helix repeat-containing protein [Clostridia bacterium]|nr:right-handed parallel beta-helix repeat-containing protein [Clostridia bacterium]
MAIIITKTTRETEQTADFTAIKEQILAGAAEATAEKQINVVVELDAGRYMVEEPLVLDSTVNPELANISLAIKAKPNMRPIVSGLHNIPWSEFTPVEGTPYYKYQLPMNADGTYPKFHDFFRGDQRLAMAKSEIWKNPFAFLPEERSGEKKLEGLYVPMSVATAAKEAGIGATELRIYVQWQHFILRIKDIDLSVTKEVNGEPYALVTFYEEFDEHFVCGVHRANNIGNRITYFINNPAFLTEPDSFAYDWHTGTVYVLPPEEGNTRNTKYGYAPVSTAFVFKGMKNVTVEGVVFSGFTSNYVCDTGYFGTLANREFRVGKLRHAPIVTSDMRNLRIKDCSFLHLGGNGVMLCDRTVKAEIDGCTFKDIAMCAISIGNYRVGNGWEDESNRTYNVKVTNNYMEHIAFEYPSTAALFLGNCDGGLISHNTIDECAYSGIAAGDGYSNVSYEVGESVNLRNVEISYNYVHNFMASCRDGGAIYVTGGNCTIDYSRRFNTIHHNFAALDELGHVDKLGYYLDGSASHWEVTDNVIDKCSMPLYTQYNIPSQYTYHVTVKNFYSTYPVPKANHRPHHDASFTDCYEADTLEELFAKYPAAKAIADEAGCKF